MPQGERVAHQKVHSRDYNLQPKYCPYNAGRGRKLEREVTRRSWTYSHALGFPK